MLTLRHIEGEPAAPAPRIVLTVAIALAVTTVLLIVAHLDHLAWALQVGEVVRRISGEGEHVINAAFERLGYERVEVEAVEPSDVTLTRVLMRIRL